MHEILEALLRVLESHFGALCAVALAIYVSISYARGELGGLFVFLKEMASERRPDGTWVPSTKSVGYFVGTATLCWSFVKVTLAVCRRIDQQTTPPSALDPTYIFIAELAVIASLVGAGYLFSKYLQAKNVPGAPDPPSPGGAQ